MPLRKPALQRPSSRDPDWHKAKHRFNLVTRCLAIVRLLRLEYQEFVAAGCIAQTVRSSSYVSDLSYMLTSQHLAYISLSNARSYECHWCQSSSAAHPGPLCTKQTRHLSNKTQRQKSCSYTVIKQHFSRFGRETHGPSTSISHRSTLNDIWSLRATEGFLGVLDGGSTS